MSAANPTPDKYTAESILSIRSWTPKLFSFRTTRFQGFRFVPGQFARLGVRKGDAVAWRAYSIVSANWDEHLEFYSIVVPGGEFTSELASLRVGDEVLVEKRAYGLLTTDRFVGGRDLWMLSTGTGLAPFLSILHDPATWQRYEHLVLVHGVRQRDELAYQDLLAELRGHELFAEHGHKLRTVQVVTREAVPGALSGRIPQLIDDGSLERQAGLRLDHERARIMICGNPDMVDDTRELLTSRGFTVSRRAAPGHVAVENLW